MRSMWWQLGILGTISPIAYRHRKSKKNLCRGGRSQDLPNTDFEPAVRLIASSPFAPIFNGAAKRNIIISLVSC